MSLSSQAIGESWCHIRDHIRAATRGQANMLVTARTDYGGKHELPPREPDLTLLPTREPAKIERGNAMRGALHRALSAMDDFEARKKSHLGLVPKPDIAGTADWQFRRRQYVGKPCPADAPSDDERREYLTRLAISCESPPIDDDECQALFGKSAKEFIEEQNQ